MSRNYIDFISAYCDSWCERCQFTDRCSHFAVQIAETMCDGDIEAAIELAIGEPRVPGAEPPKKLDTRMAEMLADNEEPGEKELEAIGREIESRRERARRHPLAETSYDYSVAARRWLGEEEHPLDRRSDPALREALAIIRWDAFLIHVKTMRALTGRDEDSKGRFWKGRVQNDWNGSAKVVLISMERSERAWRTVAAASGAEAPAVLADMLAALRARMLREFPRAMAFRRPGFDDASGRPV